MTRHLSNWLAAYQEYASVSEAPRLVHFWAGVSAVAGALRRKVWFDQVKFRWYPSFYIVIVGPPGIITKSTTADGSMDLLKQVPGIKFGPDSITWQRIVQAFAESQEMFEYPPGEFSPMSAVTYLASEFGNLINFEDKDMVNLLITLWDGRNTYAKETKTSGSDVVEGPWVNILACTTPKWISANMNENTIGGGFTSRCIFVYGEKKEKTVAYIDEMIQDMERYTTLRSSLVHDLEHIAASICGPYHLTPDARAWGKAWYEHLWAKVYAIDKPDYVNNYLARKQAHLHKLGMVLAASQRDERVITEEDLRIAEMMLNQTEADFGKVFGKIGQTNEAAQAETLLTIVKAKGEIAFHELSRAAQTYFTDAEKIASLTKAWSDARYIELSPGPGGVWLKWIGD